MSSLRYLTVKYAAAMLSLLALSLPIAQAAHADYTLEDILALKLPVITIETVDSEEPTCEYVDHPEGMAGYGIKNATKVPGRLTITLGDEVFYDSGSYEKNVSGMRIKIRGNSSAYPQKKPYKVKLEVGDDLLLRGNDETYSDKDWLLIKDSDLRQCIGYETCRLMGMEWTPGYQYVNVVMNGDYRGLYLLCEPVERNTHCRINVSKTGYIAESDAYFWNEDLYIPSFLNPFGWTFKYPDADDITGEQFAWLTGELTRLEETLSGDRYAERIDVESFARWLLTHDILGTWDSYGSNLFIARYDTLDSKVRMPVLWDFDTIFRMEGAWANVHRERFFFHQMLASVDDTFRRTYRELWNERRNDVFEGMLSFIEEFAASEEAKAVDASMRLDAERWRSEYHGITEHLDMARSWFEGREAWLDEHIAEEIGGLPIDAVIRDSIEPFEPIFNVHGIPVIYGSTGLIIRGGKKYIIKNQ
ncbi:MAG: CotH kinase family protein [Bacteroidales bacterium]|nr:CotH kinase family protein [Bacteroidales bacterium]